MVISRTTPERVFNAFRLANFSRKEGDEVKVFLLAEGVEAGRASSCATRKGRNCVPCPRGRTPPRLSMRRTAS